MKRRQKTAPQIAFRTLVIGDYDEVLAFWKSQEGLGLCDSDSREQIAQFLLRNPGLSVVVECGGKIVGTALCGHDGRRAMLYHVAVDPRHRKAGLGRELVERCLRELAKARIQKCNIVVIGDNLDGLSFWRKLGYANRPDLVFMQRSLI